MLGSGRGKSLWNIQTSGRKAAMSSLVFFLTNEIDILKKMVWFFLKGYFGKMECHHNRRKGKKDRDCLAWRSLCGDLTVPLYNLKGAYREDGEGLFTRA